MKELKCMFDFENADFFETRNNFQKDESISSALLYGKRKQDCHVSIMIPTYFRNDFISKTIESALTQTTDIPYEVVVVDNNDDFSDLETLSVLKRYDPEQICYYKNEKNLGMFGNWNRCIKLAGAEWILILHDDDLIEPDYIDEMMRVVNKNSELICIGCDHKEIDINGKPIIRKESILRKITNKIEVNKIFEIQIMDMYCVHPIDIMGSLLNREAAIETGGFDERWYPISDYIFLLNLVACGKVSQVEKPLLRYRVAVNISYRIDHVIGCLEMDVSMRKCINKKYGLKSKNKDILLRSLIEKGREMSAFDGFGSKLSQEEMLTVRNEFNRYKVYCGLKEVSNMLLSLFRWYTRWYLFKMRCLRGKR